MVYLMWHSPNTRPVERMVNPM